MNRGQDAGAGRARLCVLAAMACLCAAGAAAQAPPVGPANDEAWQRQQPTRERVRELLDQQGIQPSPEERREQLRTLNQLHRELMPPGTTVPAPQLAPPSAGTPEASRR